MPLAPLRRWKATIPDAGGAGMSSDLFQTVRDGLQPRLADVLRGYPAGRADRRQGILLRVSGGRTGELLPHQSAKRRRQRLCHRRTLVGHHQPCRAMLEGCAPGEAARDAGPAVCAFSGLRNNIFPCAGASLYAPVACASFSAGGRRVGMDSWGRIRSFGAIWMRLDACLPVSRAFQREDGSKVILPLSYGREGGTGSPGWFWKALPEPRPLYGLHGLALRPEAPVLLVEGEKTADAAQRLFPEYAVLTWSGGANAVCRSAYAPLRFRRVTIWPDNDAPGFRAVCSLLTVLAEQEITPLCVLPPSELPEAWDLADEVPEHMDIGHCLKQALPAADFLRHAQERFPGLHVMQDAHLRPDEPVELELHSWPTFFLGSLSRYSGRICPAGHAGQRGGPGSGLHNGTGALLCGSLRACSQLRAAYPRRRNCPSAPSLCRDLRQFQQGAQGNLPSSGKFAFSDVSFAALRIYRHGNCLCLPGKAAARFLPEKGLGFPCPGGI